jgi:flagellar assembly factor FliW
MKIDSKAFGEIEVDESQVLRVPAGLYGFEAHKEYALFEAEQKPFYWLQSTERKDLAFVLIDPYLFKADYDPDVPDSDLEAIGLSDPADILVMAIVTIPQGPGPITANLMGPLIINRRTRLAAQSIVADPRWKTKHDIMAELPGGVAAC